MKCIICGNDWGYSIANPIGQGAILICKPHYDLLLEAQAEAYKKLIQIEGV
jgi:hypothetical protein